MVTDERNLCMGCMSVLDENGNCRCGYNENALTDEACIPERTVVGNRYIVGRMIKKNGESITYIGFDRENEEKVFIQEYMPGALANPLIFNLFHVVMSYPIRISIKHLVREIRLLKFVIRIDDGLHSIFILYQSQPGEYTFLKLVWRLILRLILYIEYRR